MEKRSVHENIYRILATHQQLKVGYLRSALKRRWPDFGTGNKKNNRNTVAFLKEMEKEQKYRMFFQELQDLQNQLRSKDVEQNYSILRELYAISSGIHELWFFDTHFKIRVENVIKGRLGLKALLRAQLSKNPSLLYFGSLLSA